MKNRANETQFRLTESLRLIGNRLRTERESRGWSPEMAAKKTKIKPAQILAIEDGRLEAFASPAYARGFVSIYVNALDLDPADLVQPIDDILDDQPIEHVERVSGIEYRPQPVVVETREAPGTLGFKIVVACLVVLIGILSLLGFKSYQAGIITMPSLAKGNPLEAAPEIPLVPPEEEEDIVEVVKNTAPPAAEAVAPEETAVRAEVVAVTPEPQPLRAEPAVAPPEPSANDLYQIELAAKRRSFVSVVSHSPTGKKTRFAGVLQPGEKRSFSGQSLELMIAVPAAVHVIMDGVDQGPYSYSVVPASFTIPNE